MSELQRIRESREDGCMEALEYYADTFLDKGKALNEVQLKDYKEKCAILQCMGEDASKYADMMLKLLNQ
jgi:hypothetical protein